MVRTVLKDIEYKDLGWCQCHEHIYIADQQIKPYNPALVIDDPDRSLRELLDYKRAGGNTIVDAQPYGFGRSACELAKLSERSGVNIVAVSGFHKLEFAKDKQYFDKITEDEVTGIYISEIKEGMFAKGRQLPYKAGMLKCAKTIRENKTYIKLFNAVANAAVATGASVMVHVDKDADALGAVDFFVKRGIASQKIIICHLDRASYDLRYHLEVAKTGAFLEYDTINRLKYHDNDYEIKLISEMIEKGFSSSLLLSLDTTKERLKSYGADFGLDYILTSFKDKLNQNGIDEMTIENIMTENAYNALKF